MMEARSIQWMFSHSLASIAALIAIPLQLYPLCDRLLTRVGGLLAQPLSQGCRFSLFTNDKRYFNCLIVLTMKLFCRSSLLLSRVHNYTQVHFRLSKSEIELFIAVIFFKFINWFIESFQLKVNYTLLPFLFRTLLNHLRLDYKVQE